MFKVIDEFLEELKGLKSNYEVEDFIKKDKYSIVMRSFEKEFIILKIFENNDQTDHACISIDYETGESFVQYPAGFKELIYKDLESIRVEKGVTIVKYSSLESEVVHELSSTVPEGENYAIVTPYGAEGRGSGWPKEFLGL